MPLLAEAVEVLDNAEIVIKDQMALDRYTMGVATESLEKEKELATKNDQKTKPRGGRVAMLNRLLKLWTPFSRRAITVAIIRADGVLAESSAEHAAALTDHWGEVFSKKATCEVTTQHFLHQHAVPLDLAGAELPSPDDIGFFLQHARYSAPGPDGVPYAAWKATGAHGTTTLHRVLCEMCSGRPLEDEFNASLGIYPAKGTQDDDSAWLVRRGAGDTRPLNLKNCDNKAIAGAVNGKLTPPIARWADEVQEGFVRGRQAVNNVCTIDAHARVVDAAAVDAKTWNVFYLPLLLLFDLAAAFPSIAHDFLFAALEFFQVPKGLILFFRALYTNNACYCDIDGVRTN
jgi:hypothetical protein